MRTTVTPTYGVIGHGEHKYTTYIDSHYLALMAIDARSLAKGEPKQLWTAILTSSGKLFDENLSLKAMLMAIKDKIGTTQDSSYSLHMKKSQIINPSNEMGLDVDAVAYKADYYLKQANKLIDSRLPQVGKVKNWTIFCQSAENMVNGCGMSDVGITVFIDAKSHAPTVIVGEHEYLAPESEVCVEIDGDRSCVTVEAYNADLPSSKQKVFRENEFWRLEKAKKVEVVYTFDKQNMRNVYAIDMNYYLKALDVLRRSLP